MNQSFVRVLCIVAFQTLFVSFTSAENWPCWRGLRGDGSSTEANVPVRWSGTENVAWKTEIPGVGHSSPIVWGNRLFTVTAMAVGKDRGAQADRVLLCLDRGTGRILWQRTVVTTPLEQKHRPNSWASSTPATDGRLVYATFLDQKDMVVAAYDFDGNQKWLVRPGEFRSVHGFCSSPVLYKDKLIVNGDHHSASLVSVGGMVYFLADTGVTRVVKPGHSFEVAAENKLGENCHASPAISDGPMFIRAEKHLYCMGDRAQTAQ